MASMLDTGLLQFFSPVFLFILIFAISYAILDKFEVFKAGWTKAMISFAMGVLFLFSKDAMNFVNFVTPWFIIFIIIVMFFLMIFLFMGLKSDALGKLVSDPNVYWPVLIILFVFMAIAIVHVFGDRASPYEASQETTEVVQNEDGTSTTVVKTRESEGLKTIINPKLLGSIILLIIMTITIATVSKNLG